MQMALPQSSTMKPARGARFLFTTPSLSVAALRDCAGPKFATGDLSFLFLALPPALDRFSKRKARAPMQTHPAIRTMGPRAAPGSSASLSI